MQSGAVFIPAIMPTKVKFSDITPTGADQIAGVLEKFTSRGVEVWLQFAHEMNWYAGKGQVYAGGSEYQNEADARDDPKSMHHSCKRIHHRLAKLPRRCSEQLKILMFWCPNIDSNENIQPGWPGSAYVDMVGVDNYPPGRTSFAKAYGEFYDGFAARYDKSFCIGETGSFNGGTVKEKEAWVSELANVDWGRFPCYKSVSWFEYRRASDDGSSPEYDYRIVQGQSRATVNQTLSNFK